MNNDIYLIGEVGWEVTLKSLIEEIDKSDKTKPLNIHIHSGGGSVYDGLAIYSHLKNLDQEVNTISSGLVASIASIIFLAGNKETRKIHQNDNFLIHLPIGMAGGNAEDLEKTARQMREVEDKLAGIYEAETELTKEEALALMKEDDFLDNDFLKAKGFVNEVVTFKAVANLFNTKKENMSNVATKQDVENLFTKFVNKFFKPEPQNKIVQDATGTEIDFYELAEDDAITVGAKATVDNAPADGEYIMPSGETYVFANEELTEIRESNDETEDEEIEALKEENARLKTENESLKGQVSGLENKVSEIEESFTDLKNEITSKFETKKRKKKEEIDAPQNRFLRKR